MAGENMGICHSCRQRGHLLLECPRKRRCSNCTMGFIKWVEVEKNDDHKGLLFHCCTCDCRYFKGCNKSPDEKCPLHDDGESSGITNGGAHVDDLSQMLKTLTKLTEEKDLKISLKINMRKGKQSSENDI